MTSLLGPARDAVRGAVPKRLRRRPPRRSGGAGNTAPGELVSPQAADNLVDLTRRREQLVARVAELQWDLGGLVYEMAIRDSIRVEVIARKAGELQTVDSELNEVERILKLEETATAGQCSSCAAPHSIGAVFCWQCGHPLLQVVPSEAISAPE